MKGALMMNWFVVLPVFFYINVLFANDLSLSPQSNYIPNPNEFSFQVEPAANEFKVMSYNVTNLFDATHDEGKDDYSFLPNNFPGKKEQCQKLSSQYYRDFCFKNDWSDIKFNKKIMQIKEAILEQGSLPELLGLQEVENETVISKLAQALGYSKWVMTNSPDQRGIDVALLYNEQHLSYLSHEEILLEDPKASSFKTRNILKVHFAIKNSPKNSVLGVYVNHWPSQAAPTARRIFAAQTLRNAILEEKRRLGDLYHTIVLGDLNSINSEIPSPISVLLGADSNELPLFDLYQKAEDDSGLKLMSKMPPGSYFFSPRMEWNLLDRIVVSKNLLDQKGIDVVKSSYRIVAAKKLRSEHNYTSENSYFSGSKITGTPFYYDFFTNDDSKRGYSDHFGVVVKLKNDFGK